MVATGLVVVAGEVTTNTYVDIQDVVRSKIKEMPAYLRSGWNVLDFCVVVISILSLMNMDAVQGLQALRTFRALRPLRLISRLEGMRQVINTLIKSIPAVSTLGWLSVPSPPNSESLERRTSTAQSSRFERVSSSCDGSSIARLGSG